VLFHEFFHTVEKQFRDNSEKREKIRLKTSNLEEYTLENWWKDFEDYVLNPDFKPVTRYASTYKNELNEKTKINNNGDYIYSL
jgi:hypothetical protein